MGALHRFGAVDAEPTQDGNELAKRNRCGREKEGFALRILLRDDVVLMVEVVELLRELEGVLSQECRL
jgi:hypothetical protein